MQTKNATPIQARLVQGDRVRVQARTNDDDRRFGIGYGSSSGYASAKHYAQGWGQPRFRCA